MSGCVCKSCLGVKVLRCWCFVNFLCSDMVFIGAFCGNAIFRASRYPLFKLKSLNEKQFLLFLTSAS